MGRGPSYPYVGLEEAVGFARKVYDFAKRGPAPVDSVVKEAWNYSPTSSSGIKVLAALKSYGLIEDAPGTNGKSLKISPRAVRILLDEPNSTERKEEIKKAALSPKWYEYCWKHWGKDMPASMRSNLLIEHGFVDTTVDGFLRDYRKTIKFAGLLDESDDGKTNESEPESKTIPRVGDYVQWESQGVLRMSGPRKLVRFSPDGGFAFVEGSSTGIPVDEVIPAEAPDIPEKPLATLIPERKDHQSTLGGEPMLQDSFSLPNGQTVSIQWPAAFTPEAFEDFTDWLNIVKRKIGRTVSQQRAQGEKSGEETQEGISTPAAGA